MQYEENGRLIKGLGGLYEIRLDAGDTPLSARTVFSRAKGQFRHQKLTPLVGDRVRVAYGEGAVTRYTEGKEDITDGGDVVIKEILPRTSALIRPPMANLGVLFIAFAAAEPEPALETVDKLIAIAEYNGIEPCPVICKEDIAPEKARALYGIYEKAGFQTFLISAKEGGGIAALRTYIDEHLKGRIAAFAGASGVGKSTLLHALYPSFSPETGAISRKIARGKHTTRRVELYPIQGGYVADTPGFSLLDFVHFDFFGKEDLPHVMREFSPYLGKCRYTGCTHTKDEGCAILAAVRRGEIAPSRHASYLAMYEALKNKHDWSKK